MGLHLPEGAMRWIKINSVPMEGPQGRTVTTTFTDITDLVQSQAKTLQSAKLASLGEMAAGIAHEINNPLAVIAGNLHLLSKLREDPARFQSKLDAATRATDRVTKIVNGLRKFSRSSEGLYRSPEKLSMLVAEALVLVETKAKRQSVDLSSELRSDAVIECDGLEIEQVIVNLVNNAIDAAHAHPDASAPRWVRIESYDDPSGPVLRVLDSGSGIAPEVEKRLFEPFFTTKPVGQGTGLGLSIARGILQDHGATLWLNRSLPQTCFEVRFARAP
jgi:C4-dicarboxylate-specific signal transduction histidine kinase